VQEYESAGARTIANNPTAAYSAIEVLQALLLAQLAVRQNCTLAEKAGPLTTNIGCASFKQW